MTVTRDQAADHLNMNGVADVELTKLDLYVDAANGWVGSRVTDTAPSAVQLATLFLIEHWWASQRGPDAFVDDEFVGVGSVGYAIPTRVQELLGPFMGRSSPSGSFPTASAWPDPVEWPA